MRTHAIENATEILVELAKRGTKYVLICLIMLETGFRVSDVINLRKRQIMPFKSQITEKKTQKKRDLAISDLLIAQILRYAAKLNLRADDFLFPSTARNRNKHISRGQVWRVFRKSAKAAGLDGVIAPHSCRKTYARAKLAEHGNVSALQADLRHTNPLTTLGYLHDF